MHLEYKGFGESLSRDLQTFACFVMWARKALSALKKIGFRCTCVFDFSLKLFNGFVLYYFNRFFSLLLKLVGKPPALIRRM